jgi:hypothetical protein
MSLGKQTNRSSMKIGKKKKYYKRIKSEVPTSIK